jgi:beta-glucanase (GH16 family)
VISASTADAAATDACGVKLAKASGGTWTCSFVDNFSGTALDTTKWTAMDTSLIGFSLGDTCFVKDKGYRVRSGSLELIASRQDPFYCKTPWGGFTTQNIGGAIATAGKFSQTYGRFEARMKLPDYTGVSLHGGYWLNPQENKYGAWPASGEIDVAEWFSAFADKMYPSLHYVGSTLLTDTRFDCAAGAPGAFHTYAVEWSATKMDFVYDGKLCFSRSWVPVGQVAPQPFDQAFYHALVWGATVDGVDLLSDTTQYPASLKVDYVKTWY